MASVVLDRMWVHLAADNATYLRFFTNNRGDEDSLQGEVRRYAGGRRRAVSRLGGDRQVPVTLVGVTDADLAVLRTWKGVTVMVRDHRGRLFHAVFFGTNVSDRKDRSGYDVAVTFETVTYPLDV